VTRTVTSSPYINGFIERWASSGAAERANYQIFLTELCDVLDVSRPKPTKADEDENTYVFEKAGSRFITATAPPAPDALTSTSAARLSSKPSREASSIRNRKPS